MASFFCQWFSRGFRSSAQAAARTPERFPGKTPRLLILLIVCLIACLTLCDRGDNPKHKRAPSETIVGAEEETEKTAPAPGENVETDEEHPNQEQPAKECTAQSQTAKTPATGDSESNSESAGKPSSGQASSTSGSSGSSGSATDTPKEKVWVVDKAAWTEQVPEYGYGYQIYVDGSLVFETADPTAYEAKLDYYANQGTPTTQKMGQIVVGYKTINHPEEGHWEYR